MTAAAITDTRALAHDMQVSAKRGLLWAIGLSLLVHLAVLTIQVGGNSFGWRTPTAEALSDTSKRFNARLVQSAPAESPKPEPAKAAPEAPRVEPPRNTTVKVTAPPALLRAEELDPPIPKAELPAPPVERIVPVVPPAPKVEVKEQPPAPQPVPTVPELVTPKPAELKTPPPAVTPQPPVPTPTPPPPVPVVEAQPPKPEVKEIAPVPAAITPPPVAQPPSQSVPTQATPEPAKPTPAPPTPVAAPILPLPVAVPMPPTTAVSAPVAVPAPQTAAQAAPVIAAPAIPATTATPVLTGPAPSATPAAAPAASASPASSAAPAGSPSSAGGATSGSPASSGATGGRSGAVVSLPSPRTGDGTVATPTGASADRAPGLPSGNIDGFDPYKSRSAVARDAARDLNNQRGRAPISVAPSLTSDQRFRRAVADAFLPPCPQSADAVLPKPAAPSPQAPTIVNQPMETRQKEGCRGESR